MSTLEIGEVARKTGLPPATLRFYEEEGLIAPIGRKGIRRAYAESVVERLALIGLGRAAGFSLREIAGLLGGSARPTIDKARLAARAAELDAQIKQLTTVRNGLRHAAECDAPDLLSCPHFQRVLRRAAMGKIPTPPAPSSKRAKVSRSAPT